MFSFLHVNPEVSISFNSNEEMDKHLFKIHPDIKLSCFTNNDTISGNLSIIPPNGKTISHKGIVISIFGEIRNDKNEQLSRFMQQTNCLQAPGDLSIPFKGDFCFYDVKMSTSTYFGTIVNIVYGVEIRLVHRISDFVYEQQYIALNFTQNNDYTPIHNEIGIRNVLHLEFVFPKAVFDAQECLIGCVYFILVKLRIIHMTVQVYRNEVFDSGVDYFQKITLLKEYEILDGAPVKGDSVPIRLFMAESDIWPYHEFPKSPLTIDHYLKVQMTDENGKKYFKRLKINFDRLF